MTTDIGENERRELGSFDPSTSVKSTQNPHQDQRPYLIHVSGVLPNLISKNHNHLGHFYSSFILVHTIKLSLAVVTDIPSYHGNTQKCSSHVSSTVVLPR